MNKSDERKQFKKMRGFLIRRFLVTVFIVSVVELLVQRALDWHFFPLLQKYFMSSFSNVNLTGREFAKIAGVYAVEFLFRIIFVAIPTRGKTIVHALNLQLEGFVNSIIPEMEGQFKFGNVDTLSIGIFLLFMLVVLAIFLLPIILGAVYYSWVTIQRIRLLEEQSMRVHKEYEKGRNLMLADIAHDLRTPMTTINGYAKALADHMVEGEDKQQEYLDAIQRKSNRMNELIQLLFEYVKLDSEDFKLHKEKFDLAELLRQNASMIYCDMEDAEIEFEIEIPEETCLAYGDSIQVSRVVTNLLTNAIRHNEKGAKVMLELLMLEDRAVVSVKDSGDVIPEEIAKHLFEPFVVGDESRRSKGGSGLGLSIAHKIVTKHGWSLELQEYKKDKKEDYTKGFVITIR